MAGAHKFSALYFKDFRLFWTGQVISLSGTWMQTVVQSWLVYSLTKSALYLGLLPLLQRCYTGLSLLGGHVADIYPKRNIIIATQILSIVPALGLGILTDTGAVQFWHIAVAAVFLGTVNAFDVPARQAFMFDLVGRGDITNAIALNSAAFNGARIAGPAIAGIIIANVGIPACFYINAASFVPVVAALFAIKARGVSISSERIGMIRGITAGWHFVLKEREYFIFYASSLYSACLGFLMLLCCLYWLQRCSQGGLIFSAPCSIWRSRLIHSSCNACIQRRCEGKADIHASCCCAFFIIFASPFFVKKSVSEYGAGICGRPWYSELSCYCKWIYTAKGERCAQGRVMSLYTLVFLGFAPLGNSLIGLALII